MKTYLALALILFAACGDDVDETNPDASAPIDSAIDSNVDAAPTTPRAVVASGDFQTTGLLSVVDVNAKTSMNNVAPATSVGSDPVIRKFGNELFVVNRASGNSVTILKASDYSLVEQIGTGANSNPYDVAVSGNKLYVATYGNKGLVELTRGSSTITEIDLSGDDPDGKPNCASVVLTGGKLYVSCQRLAGVAPTNGNGKVYVVDPTSHAISAELDLTTKNPTSSLYQIPAGSPHAGDLLVGTVDYSAGQNMAGCVERITTGATPTAAGCFVNNTALGNANAGRIEAFGSTLYIATRNADYTPNLSTVNLTTGMVASITFVPTTAQVGDVAVCPDGQVVTADVSFGATYGVRIYGADGVEKTTAPIDIGLALNSSQGIVCY